VVIKSQDGWFLYSDGIINIPATDGETCRVQRWVKPIEGKWNCKDVYTKDDGTEYTTPICEMDISLL